MTTGRIKEASIVLGYEVMYVAVQAQSPLSVLA